ncbi:hypothetical protein [Burkholderia glumae]|uniref:SH3 domain-containing protein n=1 Tax=Burkholderia glumae TaxID=337 RepID=A0ABY5BHP6_BURGL|nr:hypothetical protein [Burkholderia glumae]MCM2481437.1 hypothetical protein [Burkholderia glumae]MCM2508423.1 hypothetical protein [Burkholderia glumae]MCM2536892.1 hypothetical protein [Burkholderia glumae]NVE22797.1 hypothetical protein [Burkholderia glumae]QGA38973.1 hypothetical protein GAS19_15920 [Burkholderia glumae]
MKRIGLAVIAALALSISTAAQADQLRSGVYALRSVPGAQLDYRKLYLAVDNGHITGFFDNPSTAPAANHPDRDPTCRFLLKSTSVARNEVDFATQFGGAQGQPISVSSNAKGVWSVRVHGDLPNCDVPTISTGDALTFSAERAWIGFATVASQRARLYAKPEAPAATRAYLVKDDVAAVLARKGDWVRVDYFFRGTDLIRWIRRSDLRTE